MRCNNKVSQFIPRGYDYKEVEYTCGSTGIYGDAVMCHDCEDKIEAGKMNRPGYCRHGTRLMDSTDHYDITCSRCEYGDDDE